MIMTMTVLDDDKSDDNINVQTVDDNSDVTDDNDDKTYSDVKSDDFATSSDDSVASRDELINEQRADPTLKGCFKLAERNRISPCNHLGTNIPPISRTQVTP